MSEIKKYTCAFWLATLLPLLAVIVSCASFRQDHPSALQESQALYLHFLTPTNTADPLAECLLTAKISVGQNFEFRCKTTGQPIRGRVDVRNGKLFATFRGDYQTCTAIFDGEAEPEKPLFPVTGFAGAIFLTYFVLSTNSDSMPFQLPHPYYLGSGMDETEEPNSPFVFESRQKSFARVQHWVPAGTSVAEARHIMEQQGFIGSEYTNRAHYLHCDLNSAGEAFGPYPESGTVVFEVIDGTVTKPLSASFFHFKSP